MPLLIALLLAACADKTVPGSDTGAADDTDSGVVVDSVDSAPADDSAPPVDADGDGYFADLDDCDDGDATIYPGATEICDEIDQDCDDLIDEDAADATRWYADADGDGFGDPEASTLACAAPDGATSDDADCDDADAAVNPDADEICDDRVDQDCDGASGDCALQGDLEASDLAVSIVGAAGEELGASVAGAGDLDGDGQIDLVIGAPGADLTATNAGAILAISGPVTDPDALIEVRYEGPTAGDKAGAAVGGCDADGDGYSDLIIGATGDDGAGSSAGVGWLAYGPPLSGTLGGGAELRLEGDAAGATAGASVAGLADRDGDGACELLVGAPGDAGGWALFLGANGVDQRWSGAALSAAGLATGDAMGTSVADAGDVNGDGFADLIVGAPGEDSGGSSAGAATVVFLDGLDLADEVRWTGDAGDAAGSAVAGVGDANGDGYADLLIGSPNASTSGAYAGEASLVLGPSSVGGPLAGADAILLGVKSGDTTGLSVAGAGDVDGDGALDLIIGAPWADIEASNGGAGCLVYGPVSGALTLDATGARLSGSASYDRLGSAVAGPGDVDGDGVPDLLLASPYASGGGSNSGLALIVAGHGL